MEKRGVIDEDTPQEKPTEKRGSCDGKPAAPVTKEAADVLEDHVTVRAANAVAAAGRK